MDSYSKRLLSESESSDEAEKDPDSSRYHHHHKQLCTRSMSPFLTRSNLAARSRGKDHKLQKREKLKQEKARGYDQKEVRRVKREREWDRRREIHTDSEHNLKQYCLRPENTPKESPTTRRELVESSIKKTKKVRFDLDLQQFEVDSRHSPTENSSIKQKNVEDLTAFKDDWGEFICRPVINLEDKPQDENSQENFKRTKDLDEIDDVIDNVEKWIEKYDQLLKSKKLHDEHRQNLTNKKKNPLSYDHETFGEKYDILENPSAAEDIQGTKRQKYFDFSDSLEERKEHQRKLIKKKLARKHLENLDESKIQLSSDTDTESEFTKFKNPKKKARKIRQKQDTDEFLNLLDDSREQYLRWCGRSNAEANNNSEEEADFQKARKIKEKGSLIKLPIDIAKIEAERKDDFEDQLISFMKEWTLENIPTYEVVGNCDENSNNEKKYEKEESVNGENDDDDWGFGTETWKSVSPDDLTQSDLNAKIEDIWANLSTDEDNDELDSFRTKSIIEPNVNLEDIADDEGRIQNERELFSHRSYTFHGSGH